jgi:hypothetical protein
MPSQLVVEVVEVVVVLAVAVAQAVFLGVGL